MDFFGYYLKKDFYDEAIKSDLKNFFFQSSVFFYGFSFYMFIDYFCDLINYKIEVYNLNLEYSKYINLINSCELKVSLYNNYCLLGEDFYKNDEIVCKDNIIKYKKELEFIDTDLRFRNYCLNEDIERKYEFYYAVQFLIFGFCFDQLYKSF